MDVSRERALEVHRECLVIDGHNDTPVERIHRGERPLQWERRDPAYHMDIPRMREGGFHAGFFVVGNGPTANVRVVLEQTLTSIERLPDDLLRVAASRDVEVARRTGRIGLLLAIEGAGRWLEGELDVLHLYHRLGVRCVGLTHGEGGDEPGLLQGTKSPFGPCSAADREAERRNAGGLTPFGRQVLEECNRLGIVTDLSHANDRAFYEALERSSLPPVVTHSAAFACCPHWRCLTDDQLRALAQAGGVIGLAFVPFFLDADAATLDRLVDHLCHVADLVGIDHVAIGSDFDGMGATVPVVPDVSRLADLTHRMLERGLLAAEVEQVWGGNFLRVLRQTLDPRADG